jgi:hypothetical protein
VDKRVDLGVAGTFLLFGAWLLWQSFVIPQGSVPDSIGSGGMAKVLSIGIIVLAGILVVRRARTWSPAPHVTDEADGAQDNPDHPASSARALGMFGLLALYAVGVVYLGYPIATPIFLVLALRLMKVHSVLKITLITVLYTVITYVLFVGVFGVLLPLGVLSPWDYYLWFHF